ncbi:unnamed protein product, partial [marine sediment metagenome]
PWGDSIYDAMRDTLVNSATASASMAALLPEAKIDVITMPGLSGALATDDGEQRLMKRFQLAALLKGINGMLVLGEGETYDQKTINFAGLPDVHARLLQEVSGAADIPLTRLLGQSPGGLQSTGENDIRNYYDGISAKQEDVLRPILDRIDALLVPSALGSVPDELWWEFNELWQLSEKDQAEVFAKTAAAVKQIADTGLVPDAALADSVVALLDSEGMLPGLASAIAAARTDDEDRSGDLADASQWAGHPVFDNFDPNQPRGPDGRWIRGGETSDIQVSEIEERSLAYYASVGAARINRALYGLNDNIAIFQNDISNIDKVIQRSSLVSDMTVYRGISNFVAEKMGIGLARKGSTLKNISGFMSTSTSRDVALEFKNAGKGILIEISAPKGHPAIDMKSFATLKENEILFPRNSELKVLSYDKKKGLLKTRLERMTGSRKTTVGDAVGA